MKHVLIIEDDPFIAMDLQDAFEDAGYCVVGPFATAQSGLTALEDARPDVALLDYNLGAETSRPVAEVLAKMAVPYIFVSGQMGDRVATDDPLSADIIAKPFVMDNVLRAVKRLLAA